MTSQGTDTRAALQNLLDRYVDLVHSGDAGFWNPEEESEVIAARATLRAPAEREVVDAGAVALVYRRVDDQAFEILENDQIIAYVYSEESAKRFIAALTAALTRAGG